MRIQPDPDAPVAAATTAVPARLRWRCRRGMRELDVVLAAFLANGFSRLSEVEIGLFEAVLDLQDPLLHAYLCGREQPADPTLARLIERIRDSHTAAT
jgi:antitoxin CptB